MANEQREAIDRLKKIKKYNTTYYGYSFFKVEVKADDEMKETIDTVLSLIKEQQEEMENYKSLYDRALSDVVKADKQIDLMAEEIIMTKPANCTRTNEFNTEKVYMSKEEIKQYFERKVEDVKN